MAPSSELDEPLLQKTKQKASLWSFLTFSWVNPLMDAGFHKQVSMDDLLALPDNLAPGVCRDQLWETWIRNTSLGKQSLFWTIFSCYGWTFLSIGLVKVINDCLSFLGPVFLNGIVKSLQSGSTMNNAGYWYACALGGVSILRGFLGTHYTYYVSKLRLKLKAGLTTIIFRKALNISVAQRSSFSTGEIQTLMSVDADRTVNLFSSMHDLWSLPMQIGVALCMLYVQVSYSFVAGLGVVLLLIPVNRWIAIKITSANKLMMSEKDERVRRTSELLTHIWTVKMYAWENLFASRIREVRNREVKHLSTRKYLDAFCVYFWACTPILFSVLTFGLFSYLGHTLDAATVFTSLALFNILISPMNSFPWVITGMVEAWVSIQRLQRFLICSELHNNQNLVQIQDRVAITLQDADFRWSSSSDVATLRNITLDVPKGSLVVVLGQVGAGKSSLLHAILNEMHRDRGFVSVQGSTAFVSQTPWIRSNTLRENILFGKPYVEHRYNQVIRSCSLDLDIELMRDKDLSEIGERGYNLSGGQKARLALARAIYQDSDIYLLDDPLSAVDAHVAAWLMNHAVQGSLLCNKTRILCTHHPQAVSAANIVVMMENGRFKYVREAAKTTVPLTNNEIEVCIEPASAYSCDRFEDEQDLRRVVSLEKSSLLEEETREQSSLIEEETRARGSVNMTVYRTYAAFTGFFVVALIISSTSLMQASKNGSDLWLVHWVDSTSKPDHKPVKFFMRVLFIIGGLNTLFTFLRAFSFAYGGLRAASRVHETLLENILRASISFFERNPAGRILNRFSSDLYTIDDSLPFIANILLAHSFSLLGILVVLCLVQWEVVVLLIPLSFIYNRIQSYYRETSRELRRLDSVTRSPIYTSFSEALDGASTIRAFQRQDMFVARNLRFVEANQQASFCEIAASLWLSIRLQMMASFLTFFVSIMALFSRDRHPSVKATTAGLAGLALSYAAPIISLLNDLLTAFAETEKEMVSVERVQQYLDVEPEVCHPETETPTKNWPQRGGLEFSHVKLLYRPELPPALDGLCFQISPGEKVGIAGRTGAGKSSILAALFRLKPITSGSITIDQVDISELSFHQLRESLAVVPQNPFLFEGTVRENLDPMGHASDQLLWETVTKCHLQSALASAGLDTPVREFGESLSVGQRQLLCLARSLIKKSPILCLDECTANVDPGTTMILRKTLAEECENVTVLMIAHRLSTISDFQRVLVLDKGKLVEQGNPGSLISDPTSMFSSLARASCEALETKVSF